MFAFISSGSSDLHHISHYTLVVLWGTGVSLFDTVASINLHCAPHVILRFFLLLVSTHLFSWSGVVLPMRPTNGLFLSPSRIMSEVPATILSYCPEPSCPATFSKDGDRECICASDLYTHLPLQLPLQVYSVSSRWKEASHPHSPHLRWTLSLTRNHNWYSWDRPSSHFSRPSSRSDCQSRSSKPRGHTNDAPVATPLPPAIMHPPCPRSSTPSCSFNTSDPICGGPVAGNTPINRVLPGTFKAAASLIGGATGSCISLGRKELSAFCW